MIRTLLPAGLILLALGACSPEGEAPASADAGVCFRVRNGAREVLDRPIANLQTCAQRLEAVRMMEGGPVEGVFEGSFIFATEAELSSVRAPGGKRYPVLTPGQRRDMQAAIRKLMDRQAEREAAAR